jgi:hypothetical protein
MSSPYSHASRRASRRASSMNSPRTRSRYLRWRSRNNTSISCRVPGLSGTQLAGSAYAVGQKRDLRCGRAGNCDDWQRRQCLDRGG